MQTRRSAQIEAVAVSCERQKRGTAAGARTLMNVGPLGTRASDGRPSVYKWPWLLTYRKYCRRALYSSLVAARRPAAEPLSARRGARRAQPPAAAPVCNGKCSARAAALERKAIARIIVVCFAKVV